MSASSSGIIEAACPPGTAISGGCFTLSNNMTLTGMCRNPTKNRWVVKALNMNGSSMKIISGAIRLTNS